MNIDIDKIRSEKFYNEQFQQIDDFYAASYYIEGKRNLYIATEIDKVSRSSSKKLCEHRLRNRVTLHKDDRSYHQICKCCNATRDKDKFFSKWSDWDTDRTYTTIKTEIDTVYESEEELILAMVNSGDYKLFDAIHIVSLACNACIGVLHNKYLPGDGCGFEEFSRDWFSYDDSCEFCKDIKIPVKKLTDYYRLMRKNISCFADVEFGDVDSVSTKNVSSNGPTDSI